MCRRSSVSIVRKKQPDVEADRIALVAARLSQSLHAGRFVLKGAMLMMSWEHRIYYPRICITILRLEKGADWRSREQQRTVAL